jgi:uncharacterized protein DUF3592
MNKYLFLSIPLLFFGVLMLIRNPHIKNSILPLIGISVILILDFFFIKNLILQFESRNYLNTTGLITHSAVTSRNVTSRSGGVYTTHTSYGVDFAYRYEVNGLSFEATRFRYDKFFWTSEWAHNLVAVHPVGSRIQVFYNPQNPADAVLSAGMDNNDKSLLLILPLLNLMAVFWGWCLVKNISKQPASG